MSRREFDVASAGRVSAIFTGGRRGCGLRCAPSMRVLLFTDTLADVNGVARFIGDAAAEADRTGLELTVFTSTPGRVPGLRNVRNFRPVAAMTELVIRGALTLGARRLAT